MPLAWGLNTQRDKEQETPVSTGLPRLPGPPGHRPEGRPLGRKPDQGQRDGLSDSLESSTPCHSSAPHRGVAAGHRDTHQRAGLPLGESHFREINKRRHKTPRRRKGEWGSLPCCSAFDNSVSCLWCRPVCRVMSCYDLGAEGNPAALQGALRQPHCAPPRGQSGPATEPVWVLGSALTSFREVPQGAAERAALEALAARVAVVQAGPAQCPAAGLLSEAGALGHAGPHHALLLLEFG